MTGQLLAIHAQILAANARVLGMQAENMQRAAVGNSMAYGEAAFLCESDYLQTLAHDAGQL